jgi:Ser/Thr protein kinase RdoA (MazF antagonist)
MDMDAKLSLIPGAIAAVESHMNRERVNAACEYIKWAYRDAAARVDAAGYRSWPRAVLHGDWHPGNLLYRDGKVVGGLDFDSARIESHPAEIANAALQFSLRMDNPDQPQSWPEGLDVDLIHALLKGYDQAAPRSMEPNVRKVLPWLMIEALVSETVVPIAATGSFARIAGSTFLGMVERKARWINQHAASLA